MEKERVAESAIGERERSCDLSEAEEAREEEVFLITPGDHWLGPVTPTNDMAVSDISPPPSK